MSSRFREFTRFIIHVFSKSHKLPTVKYNTQKYKPCFKTYPNNNFSPSIVKRIENLLNTVNIGKLERKESYYNSCKSIKLILYSSNIIKVFPTIPMTIT